MLNPNVSDLEARMLKLEGKEVPGGRAPHWLKNPRLVHLGMKPQAVRHLLKRIQSERRAPASESKVGAAAPRVDEEKETKTPNIKRRPRIVVTDDDEYYHTPIPTPRLEVKKSSAK